MASDSDSEWESDEVPSPTSQLNEPLNLSKNTKFIEILPKTVKWARPLPHTVIKVST